MNADGWKEYKLGELCESVSITHKFNKEKLIFLNTGDIEKGEFLHREYSDVKPMPGQAKKSIRKNDILFSEIRPANGRYALVDFDAEDYVVSTKLMVIRGNDKILPKYLYFFLTSNTTTAWLQHLAESRSGTFPQITFAQVSNLDINLPPTPVQQRISDFISALDEKIELNRQTNATLETIAQAIFKEWFVDFNFPGATGEMVESELGMIPHGWRVDGLGSLSYVQNGYAFKSADFRDDGEIGIIKIKNISSNIVDIINTQFVEGNTIKNLSDKFLVRPESLLIAMTGAEIGKIGLVPFTDKPLWLNQRVGMFVEKTINANFYLYILLSSDVYQTTIRNSALGSAQPNISASAIENIKAIIPDEKLVTHYGKTVKPIFEIILNNISESHLLSQTRDNILPKLMSGEIEV